MGKHVGFSIIALALLGCNAEDAPSPGEGADEAVEAGDRSKANPWLTVESDASAASARSGGDLLAGLGELLFRAPVPTGNGRSCATCHVPDKGFTISPAEIETRFQKNPKDPLFRSIDADDFANDFTTVRTKGLFRVTLPLPSNVKLVDDPAATSVQVWRAVPSVFNVKLTAPYTHDGRAVSLDEQAKGAALEHSRPKTTLPELAFDLIALFQEKKFSSPAVKNIADLLDAGQAPPPEGQDYDGPLNAVEQQGFEAFVFHCAPCHDGNARNILVPDPVTNPTPSNTPFVTVGISDFNPGQLPVREFDVTTPDGAVVRLASPDPGRMLVTGNILEFNAFDPTQLRGIGKTAPYFHDNSAPTLEAVLAHYNLAFAFAGFPTIAPENMAPLVAYLKRL